MKTADEKNGNKLQKDEYLAAEAGVKVTAKDMADINNTVTRALATLDWAGKVVSTTLGTSGKLNAEILAEMDRQQMTEEQAAEQAQKKKQREELVRIRAEARATAKPLKDSSAWNGENVTYYGQFAGEDRYITIEKNENGTYEGYVIGKRENDVQKLMNLSEEQVRKIFKGDAASENQAVENNRSKNEETPTKKPNEATNAKNKVERGEKLSLGEDQTSPRKKIARNMSEQERYEILKNRTIPLNAKADMQKLSQVEADLQNIIDETLNAKYGEKKALLKKIGEEFGVFKKYTNTDIELDFNFSKGNLKESVSKQTRNYINVAKMLTCFDSVIENAVGIEVHNRNESGYKVNEDLQDVYVLISAFEDGNTVYPVKLEIKEFKNQENTLYVAITLDGIKKEEVVTAQSATNGVTTDTARSSVISIAQLFKKINPSEERFLKYVPKQFFEDNTSTTAIKTTNTSLGPDSVPLEAKNKKQNEEYVEKEFKATPEEVKRAMKAVKQFKLLPAETREAIIEMMRSGKGIDKVTIQSIAAFMAARQGLHVRFLDRHRAEGSHTVLGTGDNRLILLDPSYNNGKHYRADIFFHELYHDFASSGNINELTKIIHEYAPSSFMRAVADRYAGHYNDGVTISDYLAKTNKKWTEANVKKYFEEYTGITYAEVMEEVAAGTMGRVMGNRSFLKSLRSKNLLSRAYYFIDRSVRAIANRAITVGGDETAGFTLTFRDALAYRRLYAEALFRANEALNEQQINAILTSLKEADERDMERATKYSISFIRYNAEQLKNNAVDVIKMDCIATIGEHEFEADGKTSLKEKVVAFFDSVGNNAIHPELGDITLNQASFRDDKAHGLTRKKINSFKAIPIAIEKGKVIDVYTPKDKPYDRITIAAPIMIEESGKSEKYYIGIMVQRDRQSQRLYLHDVITEKATSSFTTEPTAQNGEGIRDEGHLFITNILQKALSVKSKLSLSLDSDYLDAVNRDDMDVAQRMVDEAAKAAGYTERAFHGTAAETFYEFRQGREGIHFGTLAQAISRAEIADERNSNKPGKSKRIISAFIKTGRELGFNVDIGEWTPANIADVFLKAIDGEKVEIYSKENGWKVYDAAEIIGGIELSKSDRYALERISQSQDFEDIAHFLKRKGIDSIRYLNTYEGTKNEYSYILLSPEQIKSADPVTYDDAGNVIPLSERFNSEKKDIRYSLSVDSNIPAKDINGTPISEASIDLYDEKQYNSFGWARVNGIITVEENETFKSIYAEVKRGKNFAYQTQNGEYMVAVGENGLQNVIIFASGSLTNTMISKVIRINLASNTLIDELRSDILETERFRRAESTLTDSYFEEELVRRYTLEDCPTYQERKNGGQQRGIGRFSREDNQNYQRKQNGRGNSSEGSEAVTPSDNSKLSLSLSDYVPTATKEELEAELNRVKWKFEWTDKKLRDNIGTVKKYIESKHPTTAAMVELDNENKRIIVTNVQRFVDFDHVDQADKDLADLLRSIGIREDQIGAHLSVFTNPSEKYDVLDTVARQRQAANNQAENAENAAERPKVYYKNQVTRTVKAVLENVTYGTEL